MSIDFELGTLGSPWTVADWMVGWEVSYSTMTVSELSTQYILVPVAATKAGSAYNPTGDVVQFAFMPNEVQQPVTADWVSGGWDTVTGGQIYPYNAKCLIGPSGSTALTFGNYVIYLKITDNPEIPVQTAGQLTIF